MIAICPNPFRDIDFKLTVEAAKLLEDAGFETKVCPVFFDEFNGKLPENLQVVELADIACRCSIIIVIGGDGTILAVSRKLKDLNVPILGVNLGTKGFMASIEPDDLPLIVKAARGEYELSRRMLIDVKLSRNGEIIYSDSALNDAVIHGYGDCIQVTASCNGNVITGFSGDGIILSTPTGSTGYSLSAGGPIVEPDAENIIISPICAHLMSARSFVLGAEREITVHTKKLHTRKAFLAVDGNQCIDIVNGDVLTVKKSAHSTYMVNMGLRSFYELAYEKLT